ncbi:MAG: TlpA family protein disulfide reductase [Actinobacteria bacterium]|nr:TlpA family protein disulfide reductase [Actinomycetota bacterium]
MSSTSTKRKPVRRPSKKAEAARRRKSYIRWGGATAVIVIAVVLFLVTAPSDDGTTVATGQASIGEVAPAIEMVDFDGVTLTLDEYRGTPVVLNFWASWCPFCVAEMPDFEQVSQAFGEDVAFLGVNLRDDSAQAVSLAGETGVTYRLAADPNGVVYGAFGGTSMPTTVFIDADGVVRDVVAGQMSADALASNIEQLGVSA